MYDQKFDHSHAGPRRNRCWNSVEIQKWTDLKKCTYAIEPPVCLLGGGEAFLYLNRRGGSVFVPKSDLFTYFCYVPVWKESNFTMNSPIHTVKNGVRPTQAWLEIITYLCFEMNRLDERFSLTFWGLQLILMCLLKC